MENPAYRALVFVWRALPFEDQVKRLLVIFLIIISSWLVIRQQLVPETFGDIGHYRAAAVDSISALPISYAGELACIDCHDDIGEIKTASFHRDVSCEVCHGPNGISTGVLHIEEPSEYVLSKPADRDFCLICHSYNASKPTGFPQIEQMVHNPIDACMTCHDPHSPEPPQIPEKCSACHGEIARTKSVSHHAKIECIRCHTTPDEHKNNPRMVIPSKPQNRAFCGGCHSPEADSSPEIPRVDFTIHETEYLCWQCHYPHYPEK